MKKTLARVFPITLSILCALGVYFGVLHIDRRPLSFETNIEHILISAIVMFVVLGKLSRITKGDDISWSFRLAFQSQEISNAFLAAFAIAFSLGVREHTEAALAGVELLLVLTYIGLDFDKEDFEDEDEAVRVIGRRFAICAGIDTFAILCGAALLFVNQSVKGADDLANPLVIVSSGNARITAILLIIYNAVLAPYDIGCYVKSRGYVRVLDKRFTQAAAQLDSPSPADRRDGINALVRIADDSPRFRPTCLKALCTYLRTPYDPDSDTAEHEVRTTAQTALGERLQERRPGFWKDAQVDLRGAYLVDLDFCGLTVDTLFMNQARLKGNTSFAGATFSGNAEFYGTTFSGDAEFDEATFNGNAWFKDATFVGDARFPTTFRGEVSFIGATFSENAQFFGTTFNGNAEFGGATFNGNAKFFRATFNGNAQFWGATFNGNAQFWGATFNGNAEFDDTIFGHEPVFSHTRFNRNHRPVWPGGSAGPDGIEWLPALPC